MTTSIALFWMISVFQDRFQSNLLRTWDGNTCHFNGRSKSKIKGWLIDLVAGLAIENLLNRSA